MFALQHTARVTTVHPSTVHAQVVVRRGCLHDIDAVGTFVVGPLGAPGGDTRDSSAVF